MFKHIITCITRISNISVEDSIFSVNYLVNLLPINFICIRVYSYKETFSRIPFVNVPIDNNPIFTSTPLDLFVALASHLIQNQWNSAHEEYVIALWSFFFTNKISKANKSMICSLHGVIFKFVDVICW